MKIDIRLYPDKKELIIATAEKIIDCFGQNIRERGICNIALAGGSTPRDVYCLLASKPYKNRVSWGNVFIFWGDERAVGPGNPESNYGMAKQTFLEHITIPEKNVHRIRGEIEAGQAALEYTNLLRRHFKEDLPHFDFILLGVGDDGHTASLFPGTDVIEEQHQLVEAVFVPKFGAWRVTLTLPVLNAAKEIMFLVSGNAKSEIVRRVMSIEKSTKELPVTLVNPNGGRVYWMLDSEAASLIDKGDEKM